MYPCSSGTNLQNTYLLQLGTTEKVKMHHNAENNVLALCPVWLTYSTSI